MQGISTEIERECEVCEDQLIGRKAEIDDFVGSGVRHLLTEYREEFSSVETLHEPDRKCSASIFPILDTMAYS